MLLKFLSNRNLQYISILQYIDTLVEYRIVIRCSMNIEISDSAEQCMFHAVNVTFYVFKPIIVRQVTTYLNIYNQLTS